IALLHQHQRPVKTAEVGTATLRYIEVTREDIELANKLATRVLARGLDELAPQTRRLLSLVDGLVSERARKEGVGRSDVRFTQRELRGVCSWGATQLKVHLRTLVELEYVAVHRSAHAQRHVYELVHSAEGERSPLGPGHDYDENRSAHLNDRSATGRLTLRPVLRRDSADVAEADGLTAGADTAARVNGSSYVRASDSKARSALAG
ncbi:MAG TPA: hypothetical protein VMF89_22310, partial [Polyangiales bacterium]|nr:hypothetical protein [Polyangiales bacterium]